MGYFSNGTEGNLWEADNCRHCLHNTEQGCAVLTIHGLYNYDQLRTGEELLEAAMSLLIPRDGKGRNEHCAMLIEK